MRRELAMAARDTRIRRPDRIFMNDQSAETDAGVVKTDSSGTPCRPLRVWPAVLLAGLMLAARFGPALFEGGASNYWMVAVFGPLLCCLLILIWWVTASRATWKERLSGPVGIAAALALTLLLAHPTMRGPGTTYLMLPMGMFAFVLPAIFLRKRRPLVRTGTALAFALAGFGFCALLRSEGMTGAYKLDAHWRWSPTAESLVLAHRQSDAAGRMNNAHKTAESDGQKYANSLLHPGW